MGGGGGGDVSAGVLRVGDRRVPQRVSNGGRIRSKRREEKGVEWRVEGGGPRQGERRKR